MDTKGITIKVDIGKNARKVITRIAGYWHDLTLSRMAGTEALVQNLIEGLRLLDSQAKRKSAEQKRDSPPTGS